MYLDVKELSRELHIKPATLYAWAAQGKIPSVKFYGLLRFRRDEIEQWIENRRQQLPGPLPKRWHCHKSLDIDRLIARATREVYTSACGKPDQDRATRKGENHGSV